MVLSPRIGAICGLALIAVWVSLYLIAAVSAASSPYGYTVMERYLSDLGNPAAPAPWAFNLGCILAGILAIPFGLALAGMLPRRWGIASAVLVAIGGGALIGVGAFPEGSPYGLHSAFSLAFFVTLTVALGVALKPFFGTPAFRPVAAWVTAGAFALNVVLLVTYLARVGDPQLAEHLGVFSALAWTGATAAHMLRASVAAEQPRPSPARTGAALGQMCEVGSVKENTFGQMCEVGSVKENTFGQMCEVGSVKENTFGQMCEVRTTLPLPSATPARGPPARSRGCGPSPRTARP